MNPKVYVPNKSHHDFSEAERFGELVFLTEGIVNRYNVNDICRRCASVMHDASEGDHILISSLTVINMIAAAIMAHKFGRVNFLMFQNGGYVSRELTNLGP